MRIKLVVIAFFGTMIWCNAQSTQKYCLEVESYRKLDDVKMSATIYDAEFSKSDSEVILDLNITQEMDFELEETWSTRQLENLDDELSNVKQVKTKMNLYDNALSETQGLYDYLLRATAFKSQLSTYPVDKSNVGYSEERRILKSSKDQTVYGLKIKHLQSGSIKFSSEILYDKNTKAIVHIIGEFYDSTVNVESQKDMDTYQKFELTFIE